MTVKRNCQKCEEDDFAADCKDFRTIGGDWQSCEEARAHQSAEHDLHSVPPCDFPAAAPNLLPNLCSSASTAKTKPQRGARGGGQRGRKQEMREEGGEVVLTLSSILLHIVIIFIFCPPSIIQGY